jgi:predicted small secreted protein
VIATMKRSFKYIALLVALAPVLAAPALATTRGAPQPVAIVDQCYTSWSDAAPVVQREALTPVKDVNLMLRQKGMGDLVRATLCEEHGRFVYRIMVRQTGGAVVSMVLDARRPF